MSLLEVKNLAFTYGESMLYDKASMRLFEGEHAVLVGPNGCGKSTLLKLLDYQLAPDQGAIAWQPNLRVGYLDQYAQIEDTLLVKEYLYDVFYSLFQKEARMEWLYEEVGRVALDEQEKLLTQAANLQEYLLENDFYTIKSLVSKIIHGLGLEMTVLDQTIKTLSGGMRAKIILSKLLLEEADVLLLDEPTNFLDVAHIEWLGKFLNDYQKSFIVVSHQEAFLQAIGKTVFAIEGSKITRYKGDYSYYLKERTLRFEQQQKAFVSQQKFIQRTEEFIEKNIVRASTTKRAQSRRKMLEKLTRIQRPQKSRKYQFFFPMGVSTGKDVLAMNELEVGYTESLIEPLSFIIRKAEKVVITGENGIGKSTLVKTVLSIIPKIAGEYAWIDTAQIAYFEQDSTLEGTLTPFQIVHNTYPDFSRKEIMDLLGNHGVNYDMARRKVSSLSGGEKTKVRLALLRHQKANILVLDEPTNHLDTAAKEALKEALIEYQGTVILVSHERAFYHAICDYEIALFSQ